MKILALIPARGGSKGVPRKNIRDLAGKPLLAYTADVALASTKITRVVLSTDDEEIAQVGRDCGLEVPFMRPDDLAADSSPTLPVIQHALEFYAERGEFFDALLLLQPTNPFRKLSYIDDAIDLFEKENADCVFSALLVPDHYNPHWVYLNNEDGSVALSTGEDSPIPRRQSLPQAWHREGSIYLTKTDVILKKNSLYGEKVFSLEIDPQDSVNIDTMEDWHKAEKLVEERR